MPEPLPTREEQRAFLEETAATMRGMMPKAVDRLVDHVRGRTMDPDQLQACMWILTAPSVRSVLGWPPATAQNPAAKSPSKRRA